MSKIMDIAKQRAASIKELKELHLARGQAILDDKPFDDTGILNLESRIEAFASAQGIEAKRAREAEANRQAETRRRLAMELHRLEKRRLACVAEAEKACRGMVVALNEIMDFSAEMRSVCRRGDLRNPAKLAEAATIVRLSQLMSAVLTRLPHGSRFGQVGWGSTYHKAAVSWLLIETDELAADLLLATEGKMK